MNATLNLERAIAVNWCNLMGDAFQDAGKMASMYYLASQWQQFIWRTIPLVDFPSLMVVGLPKTGKTSLCQQLADVRHLQPKSTRAEMIHLHFFPSTVEMHSLSAEDYLALYHSIMVHMQAHGPAEVSPFFHLKENTVEGETIKKLCTDFQMTSSFIHFYRDCFNTLLDIAGDDRYKKYVRQYAAVLATWLVALHYQQDNQIFSQLRLDADSAFEVTKVFLEDKISTMQKL